MNTPELPNLESEITVTLKGINPEEQEEILTLAHTGHEAEAEQELLEYVLEEDHSKELRKFGRRKAFRDEWFMHERMYWFALIPVAILFYCIFSILFTGHIRMP